MNTVLLKPFLGDILEVEYLHDPIPALVDAAMEYYQCSLDDIVLSVENTEPPLYHVVCNPPKVEHHIKCTNAAHLLEMTNAMGGIHESIHKDDLIGYSFYVKILANSHVVFTTTYEVYRHAHTGKFIHVSQLWSQAHLPSLTPDSEISVYEDRSDDEEDMILADEDLSDDVEDLSDDEKDITPAHALRWYSTIGECLLANREWEWKTVLRSNPSHHPNKALRTLRYEKEYMKRINRDWNHLQVIREFKEIIMKGNVFLAQRDYTAQPLSPEEVLSFVFADLSRGEEGMRMRDVYDPLMDLPRLMTQCTQANRPQQLDEILHGYIDPIRARLMEHPEWMNPDDDSPTLPLVFRIPLNQADLVIKSMYQMEHAATQTGCIIL